jgi:hypothetical protein
VLSDIKQVLKEDAGLALNDKTKILVKGISAADEHAAAQRLLIADPSLAHLSPPLSPASFVVDGYIGLGVPIGTDALFQHFVKDKCQAIMEDVDKLDNIQDGFIHYQLIRFCQATWLQYINGHVQLVNQNLLQQQHVDHKIASALLKKGTRDAYKTWHQQNRAWVDMRLHEPTTRADLASPTTSFHATLRRIRPMPGLLPSFGTFASPAQQVWPPGNNLQDPATWDAPPSPPAQACARGPPTALRLHRSAGSSTTRATRPTQTAARLRAQTRSLSPQAPRTRWNGNGKLVLPQLNRLHEAFKRSQVSPPASSSSQDQPTRPRLIPLQRRLTQQLTKEWPQYKALRQRYAGTRFEEQRQRHLPQKHTHKATGPDSTLRVETNGLEEQTDNAQARDLYWKPLSWLGAIRPTSANDAFDPALWTTFVSTTLGVEVPVLSSLPRRNNIPLTQCGCKKQAMDFHGDHTATCTAHSGATKAHDWMVSVLGPLFRTAGHTVRTQHGVTASAGQRRGDVEIRSYLRDQAGSRSLVFDLSITHHRFGSSSHVHQNGLLSHHQDLDAPLRLAAQCKTNSYMQQYADNQNISFLPAIMSTSARMHGEFLRLRFL